MASSPRDADAASSSAATASLRAWSSSDVQGRLAWTWPRFCGSNVHAHWCLDRARRSISRRRRLAPLSYDARCAALLAPTMAPIISLWLGVPRPVADLCGSDFRAGRQGPLVSVWACVGLEAARGPGAASLRRWAVGVASGRPHAGATRRVAPLLPCTPVYGRTSWRSSKLTESVDRSRRQQDQRPLGRRRGRVEAHT